MICAVLAACGGEPQVEDIADSTAPRVSAGGEQLEGVVLDESSGLTVFRGVPFAAPPVGDRRWAPPAPHVARGGVQKADTFGPACPQGQGNHDWYRNVAELFGNPPETIGPLTDIDEDCLYLNVWTQNLDGDEPLPVMVWIYGGANMNGYAHEPNYQGHALAQKGVVFVSLNYRVGALGFMAHPALAAESERGASGNYGILDQVAALQWVQRNIAAFGGDPDNVTIFGESAGAANSGTLALSPLATGLFDRVISQSGAYNLTSATTQADAEAVGEKIAAHLGFEESDTAVEGMRALDWQRIVDGAAEADAGRYSTIVVDGYVLPDAAAELFARGEHHDIDLMVGSNAHEYYMYMPDEFSREMLEQRIGRLGEPWSAQVTELLAADIDRDLRLAADRLAGAAQFLCPSKLMAKAVSGHGGDVYFYHFTRIRPGGEKILAYHGAEIPYALGTPDDWLPGDGIDDGLTDVMTRYWVNFARTGSPNSDGLPPWPAYDGADDAYMELGDEVAARTGLEQELCAIIEARIERGQTPGSDPGV